MINDEDIVRWAYLLGPTFQIENTEGRPLTGGWMEVYIHGTRNKYYCASDFDGTLHPFKIQLDSLGSNVVLASPVHSYDIYVYNKFGSLVMSRYNVIPATGEGTYIGDIVNIDSPDNTVNVSSDGGTNWNLSIQDTVDRVEQNEQDISDIQEDLADKKDKQSELVYGGNTHLTITKISQNENGEITEVKYEPIDLPPQVPNVEITSPNGTIDVQSSTDVQTNTKTFTIDVKNGDVDYYIGHKSTVEIGTSSYDITTNLTREDGNINIASPGKGIYLVSVNLDVRPSGVRNEQHEIWMSIGPNNASTLMQTIDWTNTQEQHLTQSRVVKITGNEPILISLSYGSTPSVGLDLTVQNVSVYRLDSVLGQGGGTTYTEGFGINIEDDEISVDTNEVQKKLTAGSNISIVNDVISSTGGIGVTINVGTEAPQFGDTVTRVTDSSFANDTLTVEKDTIKLPTLWQGDGIQLRNGTAQDGTKGKIIDVVVGNGLEIDSNNKIAIDSEVGDVVETVEKLKQDLDTQITTNFDMPNISQVYDFADGNNWMTHNGACMLYQSFTIPINHELRTTTDDEDTPTLLGIYAQQNFAHKIMLALYEYTYAGEGEEAGSSTYVGDTGPVTVLKGMNEFPLKNRNPSITELRSDKVYYASLYLPSTAFVNGLYLAGCPGYGNASIPAEPRLTCATENIIWNGQELDLDDPTTTLNHYQVIQIPGQDPYYQYYIGPWVGGYNERWSSPRFYMQIRNGEFNVPVIPTVPFNTLGDNKLPRGGILASNLPNFSSTTANSGFRDVTPLVNVTITSFEWIDSKANVGGWEAGNCVFTSDYSTNLSGVSNSVVDLGEVYHDENHTAYAHRITFTTPIALTAGTTYRFLCSSWSSSSDWIWSWTDPTDVFDATNNGWYVDWSQNVSRYSHIAGQYNKLYDNNNNHYVI